MFYLPILYYPTKREERATGFLIPTYGASTLRGQSIHNAFFWAIDRSQDATIMHDWYSKAGQGVGSEYRYNFGGGADGNFGRTCSTSTRHVVPTRRHAAAVSGERSYEIRGGGNQLLPDRIRARASVDYFSSIATIADASTPTSTTSSRNQRSFGGNIVGAWGSYSMNGTFDHSEYFYDTTSSVAHGSWPRVALTRNERPLLGSPLYFSVGSEYAHLLRDSNCDTATRVEIDEPDAGSTSAPQIRYSVQEMAVVHRELDRQLARHVLHAQLRRRPTIQRRTIVIDERPESAGLFTFRSQIVGPVFNRIWDTPDNGYAEKFKHSIEPFLTIHQTSSIDNYDRMIVKLDGIDQHRRRHDATATASTTVSTRSESCSAGQPCAGARDCRRRDCRRPTTPTSAQSQYDRAVLDQLRRRRPAEPFLADRAERARDAEQTQVNATMRAEFDSR